MTAATMVATPEEPGQPVLGRQEPFHPTRAGEPTLSGIPGVGPRSMELACDALETAYWHLLGCDHRSLRADDTALFTARLTLLLEEQRVLVDRAIAAAYSGTRP